jgi:hypothetical protein
VLMEGKMERQPDRGKKEDLEDLKVQVFAKKMRELMERERDAKASEARKELHSPRETEGPEEPSSK